MFARYMAHGSEAPWEKGHLDLYFKALGARMIGKNRFSRWLVLALLLTAAEGATLLALTVPAQAQVRDDRFPFLSRQRPSQGGGFFGGLFGPPSRPSYRSNDPFHQPQPQYRTDDSRAPAPRKPDANEQVAPTTSIVVSEADSPVSAVLSAEARPMTYLPCIEKSLF